MIPKETLEKLAVQYQTTVYPNVVREYLQHLFLSKLYTLENAQNLLFKGGTALRIAYNSPRFSEDLDFTIIRMPEYQHKDFTESCFAEVLTYLESIGIKTELGPKPGRTKEGYQGEATFQIYDFSPVTVSIDVSSRKGRATEGEIESIANDFVPVYNLYRMKESDLVDEKIDALLGRMKARDFYDVYFLMRKNLITVEQRPRLAEVKQLVENENINFQTELSVFLPVNQQAIIRDFRATLLSELQRQLS